MYPERVKAFSDLIKIDEQQRGKIDKLRVKKMDSKGIEVFIKLNRMDKTEDKASIELVNVLFTHMNIPEDASNLKY